MAASPSCSTISVRVSRRLSYLNRFPLDKIKIDRSFIERLGDDAGSAAIVAAVTSIAAAFQAVTTAEGVETEEQYRLLRATAVAEMQGYLFGAPQPVPVPGSFGVSRRCSERRRLPTRSRREGRSPCRRPRCEPAAKPPNTGCGSM